MSLAARDPARGRGQPGQTRTILHLGLGAFHRAHQAVYLQRLHDIGPCPWTIAAGNIRPDASGVLEALVNQQGRYTVETVSPTGDRRYQRVEVLREIVPFDPVLSRLVAIGADAGTSIISFTVTEAGYYLDSRHRLDATSPDIATDLTAARRHGVGSTVYGTLTAILRARRQAGSGPVTLLNCDNLRHNGNRLREGLCQFIDLLGDPDLQTWVHANTTSPNCMVDRITPRVAPAVAGRVLANTGRRDDAPVMAEDFIQWVIEDDFCADRPDWAAVGVQLVDDVAPYEEAKIRILNASHSCIAWAGTLGGMQFIHEGAVQPTIRQWASDYVTDDVMACLSPSPLDLAAYRDTVLGRFANPAIADTNQRVAMDGYSKLPGFIAPTIRECLLAERPIRSVAVLPALFFAFLEQWHRQAIPYEYQDQAMDPDAVHAMMAAADPLAAFVADPALWGDLAGDSRLLDAIGEALQRVRAYISQGA